MSRPKTGSVTAVAPAGENGTRFTQSRMVSHAAAREPPIVRAIRTDTTTMPTPAMGVEVGQVVGRR